MLVLVIFYIITIATSACLNSNTHTIFKNKSGEVFNEKTPLNPIFAKLIS